MTKFEVFRDAFEINGSGIERLSAAEVFDECRTHSGSFAKRLGSFDTLEEAQALFAREKVVADTSRYQGRAYPLIMGEVVWIEQNEYDEDGEFDQGGDVIEFCAEPYEFNVE